MKPKRIHKKVLYRLYVYVDLRDNSRYLDGVQVCTSSKFENITRRYRVAQSQGRDPVIVDTLGRTWLPHGANFWLPHGGERDITTVWDVEAESFHVEFKRSNPEEQSK